MDSISETDKEKQDFLFNRAKACLKKLRVDFTDQFLKQAIIQAYSNTFETQYTDAHDSTKISVADRDDPSNLAIVLLDALKKYHIKNEVSDAPVLTKDSITLTILSPKENGQNYRALLKVAATSYDVGKEAVENYVVLKKSKFSGEPGYILNRNREIIKITSISIISALLLIILGMAIYHGVENYKLILWVPLFLIMLSGGIICYHLYKLEKTNTYASDFVKKICSNKKNDLDCKQVISSAASKLLGIISQTDIGVIYFSSILCFAVTGLLTNTYENHLSVLFWTSVLPLPYTLFSIYYQLRVIKKICVLCFTTQALLWMQFAYFVSIKSSINIQTIHLVDGIQLGLTISTLSLLYFLFIQNRKSSISMNAFALENFKFKSNSLLFNEAMAGQIQFIEEGTPSVLVLGNSSADINLTAILSLSCAPCAGKLHDLLKLADWFENAISINILIKTDAYLTPLIKDILKYSHEEKTEQALDLLTQWYDFFLHAKENGAKNPADIAAKWNKQHPSYTWPENVESLHALHEGFYKKHSIPFTPLVEYNGKLLASAYHDIELLSNRIEQSLEQEHTYA